ncbi:hypothetical protein VSH64_21565 [Amycolatopsis rhabdoformis]|uniref:SMI1/KNR4 family protein n=1 Tax=Amycolatopsis rhabdoformis TaxID=1448059 RepID=A0ABZ1IJP2_9PSEU|nr:hypothetical protein [Amycolatopsis rhabdoformis]WSE34636.1 hypothetical protein VSH64_21565 [Amycolatopsis rhabdoformis]
MFQIPVTADMRRWTVRLVDTIAVFACTPLIEDHTAARALPRAWDGRGLGLPPHEVAGFTAALGEVMKTPLFWRAYRGGAPAPDLDRNHTGRRPVRTWAEPHTDDEDGFVYLAGPCGEPSGVVGYRPVYSFTLALADLRDLRIRLAAYQRDSLVRA